jgi:alpha-N-arabinofuranosidase
VDTLVQSSTIETARYGRVDSIQAVATAAADGAVTVFVVNRDTSAPAELDLEVPGGWASVAGQTLTVPEGGDRHTSNTAGAQPVRPVPLATSLDGEVVRIVVPALSWSVITLTSETLHA